MRGGRVVSMLAAALALGGCSAVVSSSTSRMADSVAVALADHNDPETVRQAAPAYLVLLDGMIAGDPDNAGLLIAAAELYSTYASAFVEEPERAARLASTGKGYGWRGLCLEHRAICGTWTAPYSEFEAAVGTLEPRDVAAGFACAAAWATWIRANRDDWSAVADKARVEALIRRVVTLDPDYRDGTPYLYLGVLETLLPAALGGHPEEGRRHFERAIELSSGRDLMARVLLASEYARMVFDRELHDRLCREVLEASPRAPGLTLSNALAQEQARRLLDTSADYFGE